MKSSRLAALIVALFIVGMSFLTRSQTIKGNLKMGGNGGLRIIVPAQTFRAFLNVAFMSTLSAQGGQQPFTFAKVSGSFPSGIADVTSSGVIAGTPTVTTQGCETVSVTDNKGRSTSSQICITPGSPVSITVQPASPSVMLGATNQLTASMLWNVPTGQAVTDVTLIGAWTCPTAGNPGCGTVSALGVFSASGSSGSADPTITFAGVSGSVTITVTASSSNPTILNSSLPAAQNGQPYPGNTCLSATGGSGGPPYSWQTTTGSLFGLTLGLNGCITGTANAVGSNSVGLKVTDNGGNIGTGSITFTSASLVSTVVTSTTGSTTVNVGSTLQLQATANYSAGNPVNVTQGNGITPLGSTGCGNASATPSTSINCPTINLPANTLLVGQMNCSATTGTFAASDTAVNTIVFPNSDTPGPTGGAYFKSGMFYILNTVANAADVFTLSNGGVSCPFWAGNLAWYSIASPTLDQHPAGETNTNGSFSNQTNSGPITTLFANELIVQGAVDGSTNRVLTALPPLMLRVAQGGGQSALGDQAVSSIQSAQSFAMQFNGAPDNHISQTLTFSAGTANGATWTVTLGSCTVNNAGLLTANGGTSCTVQASYGGQTGSLVVTVNSPVLQSITVNCPSSPCSATVGGSNLQLTATGNYSSGGAQNLTNTAAWSSSNSSVASVNASGLVTPAATGSGGQVVITAAVGPINGTVTVNVNPSSTTLVTYFRSQFQPSIPSGPCVLSANPNANVGPGDIGTWFNVNANANSPVTNGVIDLSGNSGVTDTGMKCSALDFMGPGATNYGDLEANLTQQVSQLWLTIKFYLSPSWVNCSLSTHPCNNGAFHMFRWAGYNGNQPYFVLGNPVQGDVWELGYGCGQAPSAACTAGGQGELDPTGSWHFAAHAGTAHCLEAGFKLNDPGLANGFAQTYIDGVLDINTTVQVMGTLTFAQLLAQSGGMDINAGSQIGGSTGAVGYPTSHNYFYVFSVLATNIRNPGGCIP